MLCCAILHAMLSLLTQMSVSMLTAFEITKNFLVFFKAT